MSLMAPPDKNGRSSFMQCPAEGCSEVQRPSDLMRHLIKGQCVSRGTRVLFGVCQTSPDGSRRYAYISETCGMVGEGIMSKIVSEPSIPHQILATLDRQMPPLLDPPQPPQAKVVEVEVEVENPKPSKKRRPSQRVASCAPLAVASLPRQAVDEHVVPEASSGGNSRQQHAEAGHRDVVQPAQAKGAKEPPLAYQLDTIRDALDAIAHREKLQADQRQLEVDREQLKADTEQFRVTTARVQADTEQLKVDTEQLKVDTEQLKADKEQQRAACKAVLEVKESMKACFV